MVWKEDGIYGAAVCVKVEFQLRWSFLIVFPAVILWTVPEISMQMFLIKRFLLQIYPGSSIFFAEWEDLISLGEVYVKEGDVNMKVILWDKKFCVTPDDVPFKLISTFRDCILLYFQTWQTWIDILPLIVWDSIFQKWHKKIEGCCQRWGPAKMFSLRRGWPDRVTGERKKT